MASSWSWLWRYVAGALALALLGLRYFAADASLPPLAMVELGIHESSHIATMWAPRVVYFMAGTVGQISVPLAIGAYLALKVRDPLGGALCLGWSGLSCHGAAVYIADAPYERLELVGGNTHDWAYILGPSGFDALDAAAPLAAAVRMVGILMVLGGILWCAAMPVRALRAPVTPRPVPGEVIVTSWSEEPAAD